MSIFGLRLQNAKILRATTMIMAFVSRIFSILALMAVMSGLGLILFCIDPGFFLGPSLSRKIHTFGFDLEYHLTIANAPKDMPTIQYWNAFYLFAIIPYAILFWALNEATKFFKMIAKGASFNKDESRHIRNLARGGFLYCVTFHWMMPAIGAIVSWITAEHTSFSVSPIFMTLNLPVLGLGRVSVSWLGLLVLVCVGALVVVAELMRKASIIAEDYAKIV